MGEDASEEDTLVELAGVISRHAKEIKKFEDWLSEKTTLPLNFEKVSDVNSVKLKAGFMSSVPLSFFSVGGKAGNGLYWFSFFTFCWCCCGGCATVVSLLWKM